MLHGFDRESGATAHTTTLRYRNLLVRQSVQLKNKISGLLMEAGVGYNKQRLHKVGYSKELLTTNPDISEGLRPLLRSAGKRWCASKKWKEPWCVPWHGIRSWPRA